MKAVELVPQVVSYLQEADLREVPSWEEAAPFEVAPLAQGEYNVNYTVRQGERRWVFRVNVGTQIDRDDQILYEYRTLKLLEGSGVTPCPFYVDDDPGLQTEEGERHGVIVMEYLPGEPLDYRRDLKAAAQLFARVHSCPVPRESNHLIREDRPLTMTYQECSRLLSVYLEFDRADPVLVDYLREVLAWADQARHRERLFLSDPWPCVINTEVNSGNFIVNRAADTIHLVDWEKPLWGDPSQDLSHFCVPTTTLWKSDFRMDEAQRGAFLDAYRDAVGDAHLRDTIEERVRLRDPFNCLRGISWSAMAWASYQTGEHTLQNEDTFRKVSAYLELDFVCDLFDPYLGGL